MLLRDYLQFAWAGSIERGKGHYYRVQGPTFLLEYDNTQNDANHIHSVWRDSENDFGDDLLRRHYEQSPHQRGLKSFNCWCRILIGLFLLDR